MHQRIRVRSSTRPAIRGSALVALKVLRRTIAATAEARTRLLREAKAAAALGHPNIAVLYDYGESEGSPWLVME